MRKLLHLGQWQISNQIFTNSNSVVSFSGYLHPSSPAVDNLHDEKYLKNILVDGRQEEAL